LKQPKNPAARLTKGGAFGATVGGILGKILRKGNE